MKKKLNCVLLVDDNESDNFLHKRVIEQAGIAEFIGIASNGQEALDFLKNNRRLGLKEHEDYRPSLIFLDINMPVMDGWEFLEEYQKLEEAEKGKVIVVMLTASLNSADKARAEKTVGGGRFLYKPLTLKTLMEIMEQHFPEYL